jgi:capsular polysaccharide transport system permease protein
MKIAIKLFFIAIFLAIASYTVYVETERYESVSITLLKDLSEKQGMSLGAMLLGKSSSTMQDSKVLELYIRSAEMFNYIDAKFDLKSHYISEDLDPCQRLYKNSMLPIYLASNKNILQKYNNNLFVIYDQPSGTLSLSFVHTDPKIAKKILQSIINRADEIINKFAKENAQVALHFIEKQKKENKSLFTASIKKLIEYQNKHNTIDPNLDVVRKNNLLSSLEVDLVKHEVEYKSKAKTYNLNGAEMKMLKEVIATTKRSIKRVEAQLAGSGKGSNKLNANVFDFELLKSDMEFSKEIYKQTLINQEELKVEVRQNAKHLIIVSRPTLADSYTYPNKIWDIFTISIVIFFLYSIIMTILTIIRDHKD